MYKVHQNATLIPVTLSCRDYKSGLETIPSISVSASKDASGKIHITLANLDPNAENPVSIDLGNIQPGIVTGEVLTSKEINDFNDFGNAPKVVPAKFTKFKITGNKLQVTMPSKSVIALEIISK
jgi:alpha-N-arabinofuranosidase